MQYVLVAVVIAGFSFIYGRIWLTCRRETPLRREVEAQGITFRAPLGRVTVMEPGWLSPGGDFEIPVSSPVELIVRGDAFEVSSAWSLGRGADGSGVLLQGFRDVGRTEPGHSPDLREGHAAPDHRARLARR